MARARPTHQAVARPSDRSDSGWDQIRGIKATCETLHTLGYPIEYAGAVHLDGNGGALLMVVVWGPEDGIKQAFKQAASASGGMSAAIKAIGRADRFELCELVLGAQGVFKLVNVDERVRFLQERRGRNGGKVVLDSPGFWRGPNGAQYGGRREARDAAKAEWKASQGYV